jgi:hypothetical protein
MIIPITKNREQQIRKANVRIIIKFKDIKPVDGWPWVEG